MRKINCRNNSRSTKGNKGIGKKKKNSGVLTGVVATAAPSGQPQKDECETINNYGNYSVL